MSALAFSIAAAICGILFAVFAFDTGHPVMAILIVLVGCGVVPWLEYEYLRDNQAPYARMIFVAFILVVGALLDGRIFGT